MASGLILTSRLLKNFQFPDFTQQINQKNRNMAAVPPALAAGVWFDHPNFGNFDPGTNLGQVIFEKNTKGLKGENRLTATNKDSQAIRHFLENKSP